MSVWSTCGGAQLLGWAHSAPSTSHSQQDVNATDQPVLPCSCLAAGHQKAEERTLCAWALGSAQQSSRLLVGWSERSIFESPRVNPAPWTRQAHG